MPSVLKMRKKVERKKIFGSRAPLFSYEEKKQDEKEKIETRVQPTT